MKLVFVLFDSLNRHALSAYGNPAIETPAFDRLAQKAVTFDNHYVGSMPCMPARRDIMTGRLNFLHRAWGPLEPFDNAFPEILRQQGVYSHLITDHYHYFEDGGAGFHGRYSSWEFIRGQEKDKWRGVVSPDIAGLKNQYHPLVFDGRTDMNANLPYVLSREVIKQEADFPMVQCFESAMHFLDTNAQADNWLLQLECFDPHEPFFSAARFRDGMETDYLGPTLDWLPYGRCDLSAPEASELRANYHALVKMCDEYIGKLLDYFDEHNLWQDTALIVSTDHGLLLGEHEFWGKNRPPFFNEVTHIPLFVYDPRKPQAGGERRSSLTQTIDIMPSILDLFAAPVPQEVTGRSFIPLLDSDVPIRQSCIYGQFGGSVNVTDGQYTYFRYPEGSQEQLYHYTLMPMHMRTFFEPIELQNATLFGPLDFTKDIPVLKLPVLAEAKANMLSRYPLLEAQTVLYDLAADPGQKHAVVIKEQEKKMITLLREEMLAHDAPAEAFRRLNLAGKET
ncbi:Putative sulfatase [Sodalis praecaptivus]|uniref:Putative sulfatase n=1 Tax=Sodalis praecaptivus TaxID=1239307 RepID=W0HU22_9GAMM|nr:sulfatase [Sodalis praecaptivus]AHF77269.1 Putative sulfatase [Sodalis praecaptivus]